MQISKITLPKYPYFKLCLSIVYTHRRIVFRLGIPFSVAICTNTVKVRGSESLEFSDLLLAVLRCGSRWFFFPLVTRLRQCVYYIVFIADAYTTCNRRIRCMSPPGHARTTAATPFCLFFFLFFSFRTFRWQETCKRVRVKYTHDCCGAATLARKFIVYYVYGIYIYIYTPFRPFRRPPKNRKRLINHARLSLPVRTAYTRVGKYTKILCTYIIS